MRQNSDSANEYSLQTTRYTLEIWPTPITVYACVCVCVCVAEMSHRSSEFMQIMDAAEATLRQLLWAAFGFIAFIIVTCYCENYHCWIAIHAVSVKSQRFVDDSPARLWKTNLHSVLARAGCWLEYEIWTCWTCSLWRQKHFRTCFCVLRTPCVEV